MCLSRKINRKSTDQKFTNLLNACYDKPQTGITSVGSLSHFSYRWCQHADFCRRMIRFNYFCKTMKRALAHLLEGLFCSIGYSLTALRSQLMTLTLTSLVERATSTTSPDEFRQTSSGSCISPRNWQVEFVSHEGKNFSENVERSCIETNELLCSSHRGKSIYRKVSK